MSESLFPEILTVETPPEIEVQDSSVCFYCKSAPIPEHITYCPQCGFPQHASKEEQIEFINELRDKVKEHTRLEEIIGWSQTILFFTGITAIVGVLIQALPFFSVSSHLNLPVKDFIYVLIAVAPNFMLCWDGNNCSTFSSSFFVLGINPSLAFYGSFCSRFVFLQ
jgi:hypothetical protein